MKKNLILMASAAIGLLSLASCKEEVLQQQGVLTLPEQQTRMENALEAFAAAAPADEFKILAQDQMKFGVLYGNRDYYQEMFKKMREISDGFSLTTFPDQFHSLTEMSLVLADFYGTIDFDQDKAVYTPDFEKGAVELNFTLPRDFNERPQVSSADAETAVDEDVFKVTLEQVGKLERLELGKYLGYGENVIQVPVDGGQPAPEPVNTLQDGTTTETPSDPQTENNKNITVQDTLVCKVTVPEAILVTVLKNGELYADARLDFQHNVSEGGIDFAKDMFGCTVTVNINGFTLKTGDTFVDFGAERMTGKTILSKGGQEIIRIDSEAEIAFDLLKTDYYDVYIPELDKEYKVYENRLVPTKLKNVVLNFTFMNDVTLNMQCVNALQALPILLPMYINVNEMINNGPGGPVVVGPIRPYNAPQVYGPSLRGPLGFIIINNEDLFVTLGTPVYNGDEYKIAEWTRKISVLNKLMSCEIRFVGSDAVQGSVELLPKIFNVSMPGMPHQDPVESTLVKGYLSLSPVITYPDGSVFRVAEFAAGLDLIDMMIFTDSWSQMIRDAQYELGLYGE